MELLQTNTTKVTKKTEVSEFSFLANDKLDVVYYHQGDNTLNDDPSFIEISLSVIWEFISRTQVMFINIHHYFYQASEAEICADLEALMNELITDPLLTKNK